MKADGPIKLIMYGILFIIVLDIAGLIGSYLAYKESNPEIVNEKTWQEVCVEAGIDTNTVSTTSDPTDEELKKL